MQNDFKNLKYLAGPRRRQGLPLLLLAVLVLALGAYLFMGDDAATSVGPATPTASRSPGQPLDLPAPAAASTRVGVAGLQPPATPVMAASGRQKGQPPAGGEAASETGHPAPDDNSQRAPRNSRTEQAPPNLARAVQAGRIQSPADPPAADTPPGRWLEAKVKAGDSLARIFKRLGLSPSLLHRIINSSGEAAALARIRPGQTLRVHLDAEGKFRELIHRRSAIESLRVAANGDGFTTTLVSQRLEKRIAEAQGIITSSLYQSAKRAGLDDAMVMELANIFGWDIDFALEIRAGDRFSLIYEELYLNGKKYRNGPILAAEFINRGKVHRAVRYEDEQGNSSYYAPDGSSMRKAFLRAPVDFRRISSRFTKARWHPVLGRKRPHRGVDYAAAIGTPIKAAGDGRVIFRGRKGGYGNAIIIQHGNQYSTLYAHMSRFKRSVKKGSRVKQGQIIGYVGKSGLATGPHLHYEFRVNGVHRNPLTVKLPASAPIERRYRADFEKRSRPLLARLDQMASTVIARAE